MFAHAKLVRSNPAPGATLDVAPARLDLVFTEKPELSLSSMKLVGPVGDTIVLTLRRDSSDAHTLTASVPIGIIPGKYRVVWRVAGSDGHPSRGVIDFVVKPGKTMTGSSSVTAQTSVPDDSDNTMAVGGAIGAIAARWMTFISTFLLIGAIAFRFLVLRRMNAGGGGLFAEIAETNAATLGILAAVGAILAGMVRINRELGDMPDVALDVMMLDSTWGLSMLLHIGGALLALVALFSVHRVREMKRDQAWKTSLVSLVPVVAGLSLGGHTLASEPVLVSVFTDIIHIAAGSAWLGTLAAVMMVGISAALKTPDTIRPGERVASMINAFSPVALVCGGTIVATGLISAKFHLPTWASLWTTPYGAALMLKLFFVALLFGAGAWNWRRMKPRLTGDDAISPMRSSATLELVIAAVVLNVTAILVALELP